MTKLSRTELLRGYLQNAYESGDTSSAGTDERLAGVYGFSRSWVGQVRRSLGIAMARTYTPRNPSLNLDPDLLAFAAFVGCEGVPPTVREFQEARGFTSTSVANYHLRAMEKAGLIESRKPGMALSRAYRLTNAGARRVTNLTKETT